MTKCKKCKCPTKVDIQICVPEGIEIGAVEIFQVAGGKPVGEFKPGRVEEGDWDSDEDDEDYVPGIDSEDDPYEHADLTDKDKEELRQELTDILIDMAQDKLDNGSDSD
tara:strand:- start:3660 stop:3986 length:327 start_codon:yes stop_codon:yes gene_type:complete